MIAYVCLGTNDLEKGAAFYDALLGTIGAGRAMEMDDRFVAWSKGAGSPLLSLNKPFNGETATTGNGVMMALSMDSKEQVDEFYAKAIALGAQDEGEPGVRSETFYGAYFRDPDGNKLCACHFGG